MTTGLINHFLGSFSSDANANNFVASRGWNPADQIGMPNYELSPGLMYYNTSTGSIRFWDGSIWEDFGAFWGIFTVINGDLEAQVTAAGANERTFIIHQPETIAANCTVPENITLWFVRAGSVSVPAGPVLTIQGKIDASPKPILSSAAAGGVVITGGTSFVIHPEWFGAVRDGVADDTAAIQAAISAMRVGTLRFLPGPYLITATITVPETSLINFEGAGQRGPEGQTGGSIIRARLAAAGTDALHIYGMNKRWMRDLCFETDAASVNFPRRFINLVNGLAGGGTTWLEYSQFDRLWFDGLDHSDGTVAIACGDGDAAGGDNLVFRDCKFNDLYAAVQIFHNQAVGQTFSHIHLADCEYGLAFTPDIATPLDERAAGCTFIHTLMSSGTDTNCVMVYIPAGTASTVYDIVDISTERNQTLLYAGIQPGHSGQITVNVIGPRTSIVDGRTVPIIDVGAGAQVNVYGGRFRFTPAFPSHFRLLGTRDEGDAVLRMFGTYCEEPDDFSVNANTWGFYDVDRMGRTAGGGVSRIVGNLVITRATAQECLYPIVKLPWASKGTITMPLHANNPAGSTVLRRTLPPRVRITKISVYITTACGTPGESLNLKIPFAGPLSVAVIDANCIGDREIGRGWARYQDSDPGAAAAVTLLHPNFVAGLEASEVAFIRSSDNVLPLAGQAVIEYEYVDGGVLYDVTP